MQAVAITTTKECTPKNGRVVVPAHETTVTTTVASMGRAGGVATTPAAMVPAAEGGKETRKAAATRTDGVKVLTLATWPTATPFVVGMATVIRIGKAGSVAVGAPSTREAEGEGTVVGLVVGMGMVVAGLEGRTNPALTRCG